MQTTGTLLTATTPLQKTIHTV